MIDASDMATMFYRMDCKKLTGGWSKDKKIALAKAMSKVTLEDGRFHPHEREEIWSFQEVPQRKFSALKILAWMEELLLGVKGFDVDPKVTKMVKIMEG